MKDKPENAKKPMAERQRVYIERLLINKRIDENYKNQVKRGLQNGLSSFQASKIIDFLKSCIEFKRTIVIANNGLNDGESLKQRQAEMF